MSVLNEIFAAKQNSVDQLKQWGVASFIRDQNDLGIEKRSLQYIFPQHRLNVIAEVKFASPSEGILCESQSPTQVAKSYLDNGACGLSVLTEEKYFKGSPNFLLSIKSRFPQAFCLMKDFILDPVQIELARTIGAEAVLLILSYLEKERTFDLMQFAKEMGLHSLVEVHNEKELELAFSLGANFIGVNNRNLHTLEVSLEVSKLLAPYLSENIIAISESGLSTSHELNQLRDLGYRGFLIGTSFMRTGRPGEALRNILQENLK